MQSRLQNETNAVTKARNNVILVEIFLMHQRDMNYHSLALKNKFGDAISLHLMALEAKAALQMVNTATHL